MSAPCESQISIEPLWKIAIEDLLLGENEVHIWRIDLEQPETIFQRLRVFLAPEELERAARFRLDHLRRKFIQGRGFLRSVLAAYLETRPSDITFEYLPYGKPALGRAYQSSQIKFNLAHSNGFALAAITRKREIGVDLEYLHTIENAGQIVSRYFSVEEKKVYHQLSPQEQESAFFGCWTRKEAFIKAIGEGVSHPLDRFSVTISPGIPASLLHIDHDSEAADHWSLYSMVPKAGYIAALAVEGRLHQLDYWQWSTSLIN